MGPPMLIMGESLNGEGETNQLFLSLGLKFDFGFPEGIFFGASFFFSGIGPRK